MMRIGYYPGIGLAIILCLCLAGSGCTSPESVESPQGTPVTSLAGTASPAGQAPVPILGAVPDPVFPEPGTVHERRQYTPRGGVSRSSVGKTIRNNGAAGNVYLEVRAGDLTYSKVFFMEAGESVEAWISFGYSLSPATWSVRSARERDTDQREIGIER